MLDLDTVYTAEQAIENKDFANMVNLIKDTKQTGEHWELDMIVDCDFNWAEMASKMLEQRASQLILEKLTIDELMAVSTGVIDINEIYRAV